MSINDKPCRTQLTSSHTQLNANFSQMEKLETGEVTLDFLILTDILFKFIERGCGKFFTLFLFKSEFSE